MSMSMNREERSSVTAYRECIKHEECKKFVSNADKTALDSVFCTCGCYKKDHKRVKLVRRGPTKASSSAAPASNTTVLPPPPPPAAAPAPPPAPQAPAPAPTPDRRPLIVYVRRNGVSSVPRSKEVLEEKKKEEEVLAMREVVVALPAAGAAAKRGCATSGMKRRAKKVVVGLPAGEAGKSGCESSSGVKKKRVRTNFSELQKKKLWRYAEMVEWRVLKRDQEKMIHFCNEIGITPLMCKNWINKHKDRHSHPSTSSST